MKTGYILWYDYRDGYGIVKDELENEIYIDSSVLLCDPKDLKYKTEISFELNPAIKDCRCGKNIKLLK